MHPVRHGSNEGAVLAVICVAVHVANRSPPRACETAGSVTQIGVLLNHAPCGMVQSKVANPAAKWPRLIFLNCLFLCASSVRIRSRGQIRVAPLAPGKIAATPFWIIVSVAHFLPGANLLCDRGRKDGRGATMPGGRVVALAELKSLARR